MTIISSTIKAGALATAIVSLSCLPGFAQNQKDEKVDLSALACKTVMTLSGTDRDTTISFIHGYLTGKQGKNEVDLAALTEATEAFIDKCLDAPKAGAVATMQALVK